MTDATLQLLHGKGCDFRASSLDDHKSALVASAQQSLPLEVDFRNAAINCFLVELAAITDPIAVPKGQVDKVGCYAALVHSCVHVKCDSVFHGT